LLTLLQSFSGMDGQTGSVSVQQVFVRLVVFECLQEPGRVALG
jgi:hypothetical protein